MPSVLFLDIDGVLNGHSYDDQAQSSTISPRCVERLNRVLASTRCSIVISSAWRYMILGGAMTLRGFEYLLRTHGVWCPYRVIGFIRSDLDISDPNERGRQVKEWLAGHPEITRYAVVDDLPGFDGMPVVRTDGRVGISETDADRLIELLGRAG